MISGKEFYQTCNWNLCNRYPINFNISKIKPGDYIFINLDNFYHFVNFTKSSLIKDLNLVTHNSDLSFTKEHFESVKNIVNKVYAINCTFNNENVIKIPLGFSDRLEPIISKMNPDVTKENFLYVNFNIHSGRISERTECRKYFLQFNWITFEDLVTESKYYETLSKSKYCVCPIGAGLDTHRFYESIYFNTIPIIKRNAISDLHEKFPCIIVDNWDEINYEDLNNDYEKNYNILTDWKNNNDWLNIKFWLK
jgi:hypothetical protein